VTCLKSLKKDQQNLNIHPLLLPTNLLSPISEGTTKRSLNLPSPHPPDIRTVVTCIESLKKDQEDADACSMLVVGTEAAQARKGLQEKQQGDLHARTHAHARTQTYARHRARSSFLQPN
jgi:hypothetical protein